MYKPLNSLSLRAIFLVMIFPHILSAATPPDLYRPSPLLAKATALIEKGQYEKALSRLKLVKKQLRKSELDVYFYLKGKALYESKKFQEAEDALRHALTFRAKSSDALHLLGASFYQQSQVEQAKYALEEAIWFHEYHDFQDTMSWFFLAKVYSQLGEKEKSIAALEKGTKKGLAGVSESPEPTLLLAESRLEAGEIDAAKKLLSNLDVETPYARLRKETLLAQALLLSPKKVLPGIEISQSAKRLEAQLAEEDSSTLDTVLVGHSYELLVRLWLTAGDPKKALESLQLAKAHYNGHLPQGFTALEQQIALTTG